MAQDTTVGGLPEGLSGAVDQLLAHPEILSMVASALGKGGPTPNAAPPAATEAPTQAEAEEPVVPSNTAEAAAPVAAPSAEPVPADLIATLAPILTGLSGKGGIQGRKDDPRACLLRALKPYVNPARREAIDYMIRISQISDLFRQLT